MSVTEITDRWVEAAAGELYEQTSGRSWHAAHHDLKQQFRTITRAVIERGRVAEIAHRCRPIDTNP